MDLDENKIVKGIKIQKKINEYVKSFKVTAWNEDQDPASDDGIKIDNDKTFEIP